MAATENFGPVISDLSGYTAMSLLYDGTYAGMAYTYWGNYSPTSALAWAHGGVPDYPTNFSNVVDPLAVEFYDAYRSITDPGERAAMAKEENLRQMGLCWEVALPAPNLYLFWQPWLKGYHGERGVGSPWSGGNGVYRFVWLDLELKKAMGY